MARKQRQLLDEDTIQSLSHSDDAPRKLKRGALLHKSEECKRNKHTFCSGSHCICACHAGIPESASLPTKRTAPKKQILKLAEPEWKQDACKNSVRNVYKDAYVALAINDSTSCRVFVPSLKIYLGPWVKKPKLAWKRAWEYLQAGLDKESQ